MFEFLNNDLVSLGIAYATGTATPLLIVKTLSSVFKAEAKNKILEPVITEIEATIKNKEHKALFTEKPTDAFVFTSIENTFDTKINNVFYNGGYKLKKMFKNIIKKMPIKADHEKIGAILLSFVKKWANAFVTGFENG